VHKNVIIILICYWPFLPPLKDNIWFDSLSCALRFWHFNGRHAPFHLPPSTFCSTLFIWHSHIYRSYCLPLLSVLWWPVSWCCFAFAAHCGWWASLCCLCLLCGIFTAEWLQPNICLCPPLGHRQQRVKRGQGAKVAAAGPPKNGLKNKPFVIVISATCA